jgi:hypothetical protein
MGAAAITLTATRGQFWNYALQNNGINKTDQIDLNNPATSNRPI